MCELLGVSSRTPDDYREVLRSFYKHSYDNPHGWGIMYQSGEDLKFKIVKEAVNASDSTIIGDVIDSLPKQNILLSHIRYATVGATKYDNCHPFVGKDISGRTWTLIHNGTIYSGNLLSKYKSVQKGNTDSERILLYLLEEMNRAIEQNKNTLSKESVDSENNLSERGLGEKGLNEKSLNEKGLSEQQRFDVIDRMICDITPRNKVNIMIYDGELLYAHKNMKNTLSFKRQGDGIVIATKPVDDDNWIPLPTARLLGFKAGKMIYQGTEHGNIFVSSLENITQFDAMNI